MSLFSIKHATHADLKTLASDQKASSITPVPTTDESIERVDYCFPSKLRATEFMRAVWASESFDFTGEMHRSAQCGRVVVVVLDREGD